LNLRPPGPQPERWGASELMGPVFVGCSASECVPVALNLFPKLFPEHVFVTERSADAVRREKLAAASVARADARIQGKRQRSARLPSRSLVVPSERARRERGDVCYRTRLLRKPLVFAALRVANAATATARPGIHQAVGVAGSRQVA
jgi:hypothetical protein